MMIEPDRIFFVICKFADVISFGMQKNALHMYQWHLSMTVLDILDLNIFRSILRWNISIQLAG